MPEQNTLYMCGEYMRSVTRKQVLTGLEITKNFSLSGGQVDQRSTCLNVFILVTIFCEFKILFLGRALFFIFQFEQPLISRPLTHLDFNVVRILKCAQINGPSLIRYSPHSFNVTTKSFV